MGKPSLDFESLFEAEYERLFRAMYVLTGSRMEADDLAQETFVRAYERWERVARADLPGAYLFKIAFNLHRSRLRSLLRGIHRPQVDISSEPDPSEEVEVRSEVRRVLASLPRSQREAVVLVEWLGFTSAAAASILRIDPASVRGRIHRARQELRKHRGNEDG